MYVAHVYGTHVWLFS